MDIVDIRIQVTDIPRQNVFTRDNIVVNIDSVLYWHVLDPYAVVYLVQNINTSLIEKTQTTLREIIGQKTVQELLEHREQIADHIEKLMDGPAKAFGVKIESILIKDMQFSADLLDSFSSAIKQKRIGEAKIIAAQAEVEAAKMMKEAAEILNTEAAMQIRYLETLNMVSKNSGEKLLFIPVNHDQLNFDENANRKYGKPQ